MTKIEIFALVLSCAAVCIGYCTVIAIILYNRINSAVKMFAEDMDVEQKCRIDQDSMIDNKLKETYAKIERTDERLNEAINNERQLRIKSNAELLDSVSQQFKQISFQSGRIDILTDRTNDLDKRFNDVLIAKSVEQPETFRSRAAEGRCVFCGKKVDPVFIMPLMINTKALAYANGQELYTCEECYKKFDQFIAGRRVG